MSWFKFLYFFHNNESLDLSFMEGNTQLCTVQLISNINVERVWTGSFSLVTYKSSTKEFQVVRSKKMFWFFKIWNHALICKKTNLQYGIFLLKTCINNSSIFSVILERVFEASMTYIFDR